MHFAFDGWQLATQPESPMALRLHGWLKRFAAIAPQHRYTLFHPLGKDSPLPDGVEGVGGEVALSDVGRLRWEQLGLPGLARGAGADVLCFGGPTGSLFSRIPIVSIVDADRPRGGVGLANRVRGALGLAGVRAADRALSADDLGDERRSGRAGRPYFPFVDAAFTPKDHKQDRDVFRRYDLQYGYALCHSPVASSLPALLAAWSWAGPSAGPISPLVFLGLDSRAESAAKETAAQFGVGESTRLISGVGYSELPAIYRGAQVLLHPGMTRSAMELRWAMAAGTPVAGYQGPTSERVMGSAGYLVTRGEARALGAACLTLLADEHAAESLSEAGLKRAAAYRDPYRVQALLRVLEEVANP